MTRKQIKMKYKDAVRLIKNKLTEKQGATNCYKCKSCSNIDKYVYLDTGVTPMFMDCTVCGGSTASTMGNDIAQQKQPIREWYRPRLKRVLTMENEPRTLDHVLNGGLLCRALTKKNQ